MERLEVQLVERQMEVDLQFTSTAGTVCISQSREREKFWKVYFVASNCIGC